MARRHLRYSRAWRVGGWLAWAAEALAVGGLYVHAVRSGTDSGGQGMIATLPLAGGAAMPLVGTLAAERHLGKAVDGARRSGVDVDAPLAHSAAKARSTP